MPDAKNTTCCFKFYRNIGYLLKMFGRRAIRNFLVGRDQYILSKTEFKRAIVIGYVAFLGIAISLIYLIVNSLKGGHPPILYTLFTIACGVAFFLNRYKKSISATIVLFICSNLAIYWLTETEPFATGVYIYYLVTSLSVVAFLGYKNRFLAIGLSASSAALFLLAYYGDLLPNRELYAYYAEINFGINFFITLLFCLIIVYFLISVHFYAERTLQQSEKSMRQNNRELMKVNAELDRFVYSASHDLRAPLSSLLGLISIAERTKSEEELQQYLKMMKNRIGSMEQFIKEIIDFSRNARMELQIEPVNILKMVREIIENLRFLDGASQMTFQLEIDTTLSAKTDPVRLKMVLSNLLSNAIRYRDRMKKQQMVVISAEEDDETVRILVHDNGVGIEPEHQKRIFEMFYRGSEHSEGSGLGLYIVQETLTKISGKITVESTKGEGSTFNVSLPLSPDKPL